MQHSQNYLLRMQSVLRNRVDEKRERETPRFLHLRQGLTAVLGAVVVFFVLKGAAMAAGVALASPLAPDAGFASLVHHWFLGADPVSSTLALAMQGGALNL